MISAGRRRALKALAAAPFALSLRAAGAAPATSERLLVLVFLYGGNDGYNTWVPYTERRYYEKRPTIAVPRDAVIKVTDRQGFHPSLAPLLPLWESRELALVQGIGYPEATQQHYRDIEIAFTANDTELASEGWVSRAWARQAGERMTGVAFEVLDIRELDPMGPFRGERVGTVQVHHAHELLARRRVADCVVEANRPGKAALARQPLALGPALRTSFPDEPFGHAVRAAVELAAVHRDVPVIHITLNGLDGDKHHSVDTHWNQLAYHGATLGRLAQGLAALKAGLVEIGRWNETLVATYDEFGRSPIENENRGTHHGLANTHFVLGGRVKGGLYGAAPPVQDLHPIGGPPPVIDTRRLWGTVVRDWWSGDARAVLGSEYPPLDLVRA